MKLLKYSAPCVYETHEQLSLLPSFICLVNSGVAADADCRFQILTHDSEDILAI